MMKILALAFIAFCAQAESITVKAQATETKPGAPTMNFSSVLIVPPFDRALGSLRSVSWRLTIAEKLRWAVAQPNTVPFSELVADTMVVLLGQTHSFSSQSSASPREPCGVALAPACLPVGVGFKDSRMIGRMSATAEWAKLPSGIPVITVIKTSTRNIQGGLGASGQEVSWTLEVTYDYTP